MSDESYNSFVKHLNVLIPMLKNGDSLLVDHFAKSANFVDIVDHLHLCYSRKSDQINKGPAEDICFIQALKIVHAKFSSGDEIAPDCPMESILQKMLDCEARLHIEHVLLMVDVITLIISILKKKGQDCTNIMEDDWYQPLPYGSIAVSVLSSMSPDINKSKVIEKIMHEFDRETTITKIFAIAFFMLNNKFDELDKNTKDDVERILPLKTVSRICTSLLFVSHETGVEYCLYLMKAVFHFYTVDVVSEIILTIITPFMDRMDSASEESKIRMVETLCEMPESSSLTKTDQLNMILRDLCPHIRSCGSEYAKVVSKFVAARKDNSFVNVLKGLLRDPQNAIGALLFAAEYDMLDEIIRNALADDSTENVLEGIDFILKNYTIDSVIVCELIIDFVLKIYKNPARTASANAVLPEIVKMYPKHADKFRESLKNALFEMLLPREVLELLDKLLGAQEMQTEESVDYMDKDVYWAIVRNMARSFLETGRDPADGDSWYLINIVKVFRSGVQQVPRNMIEFAELYAPDLEEIRRLYASHIANDTITLMAYSAIPKIPRVRREIVMKLSMCEPLDRRAFIWVWKCLSIGDECLKDVISKMYLPGFIGDAKDFKLPGETKKRKINKDNVLSAMREALPIIMSSVSVPESDEPLIFNTIMDVMLPSKGKDRFNYVSALCKILEKFTFKHMSGNVDKYLGIPEMAGCVLIMIKKDKMDEKRLRQFVQSWMKYVVINDSAVGETKSACEVIIMTSNSQFLIDVLTDAVKELKVSGRKILTFISELVALIQDQNIVLSYNSTFINTMKDVAAMCLSKDCVTQSLGFECMRIIFNLPSDVAKQLDINMTDEVVYMQSVKILFNMLVRCFSIEKNVQLALIVFKQFAIEDITDVHCIFIRAILKAQPVPVFEKALNQVLIILDERRYKRENARIVVENIKLGFCEIAENNMDKIVKIIGMSGTSQCKMLTDIITDLIRSVDLSDSFIREYHRALRKDENPLPYLVFVPVIARSDRLVSLFSVIVSDLLMWIGVAYQSDRKMSEITDCFNLVSDRMAIGSHINIVASDYHKLEESTHNIGMKLMVGLGIDAVEKVINECSENIRSPNSYAEAISGMFLIQLFGILEQFEHRESRIIDQLSVLIHACFGSTDMNVITMLISCMQVRITTDMFKRFGKDKVIYVFKIIVQFMSVWNYSKSVLPSGFVDVVSRMSMLVPSEDMSQCADKLIRVAKKLFVHLKEDYNYLVLLRSVVNVRANIEDICSEDVIMYPDLVMLMLHSDPDINSIGREIWRMYEASVSDGSAMEMIARYVPLEHISKFGIQLAQILQNDIASDAKKPKSSKPMQKPVSCASEDTEFMKVISELTKAVICDVSPVKRELVDVLIPVAASMSRTNNELFSEYCTSVVINLLS